MRDGDRTASGATGPDERRIIGIDVGTSSAKGVVIDERGAVLAEAEHPIPISMPHPGWSEQDPEDWWTATESVLARLDGDAADGIGLSGQMHGLVVLGSERRPLRPAILWNDGRSQPQATRIEQELGIERLVALSGNRALAGFTAPKLTWLAEHEPDVHRRIERVLLPKDYVRFRLTGELATDVSDASGTVLLDVGRRAWSAELGDAFAVDPSWLPAVHESRRRDRPHRRRRAGGRRRGRPGGGGTRRRRHRRPQPGLAGPRHQRRHLHRAQRLHPRPGGAPARVLPRAARHLARDGGDPVGGRGAELAGRHARRGRRHRGAAGAGGGVAPGGRGPHLRSLPVGRAHPVPGLRRARRLRRPGPAPRPRCAGARGARGRRLRAARRPGPHRRHRPSARARPRLGRRRALGPVAEDPGQRPRAPAGAHGVRGRRRLRRGAAGRRGRRRVRRRALRRPGRGEHHRPDRPRPGVGRALRRARPRYQALYPALSGLPA